MISNELAREPENPGTILKAGSLNKNAHQAGLDEES